MILDKVNYPDDLKRLSLEEKEKLAQEIREKIIDSFFEIAKTQHFHKRDSCTNDKCTYKRYCNSFNTVNICRNITI